MPKYSDPSHPGHVTWLIARRKRFEWILREGKRVCRLSIFERAKVIELADAMKAETEKMEKENVISND